MNDKTPKGAVGNTESQQSLLEKLLKGSSTLPSTTKRMGRAIQKAIRQYSKEDPKLEPTVKLPERKVPKGEKPNMLDVAGGATTVHAAKGGLIKKKKSKKSGRAAKRGYGCAK